MLGKAMMTLKGYRIGWAIISTLTLVTSVSEAASPNIPSLQSLAVVRTNKMFAPNSGKSTTHMAKSLNWRSIRGGGSSSDNVDPFMTIQDKSSVKQKRQTKKVPPFQETPKEDTSKTDPTTTSTHKSTHNVGHEPPKPNSPNVHPQQPIIQAILLPRRSISVLRILRLISAFLFTSSLSECLRTSGQPHHAMLVSTLISHHLLEEGTGTITNFSPPLSALQEYLAKKIITGQGEILPPKYLPKALPLLGLMVSLFITIGLTVLFPKWFLSWRIWLNYHVIPIDSTVPGNDILDEMEYFLSGSVDNALESDDLFYSSQLINREASPQNSTGLALLVQMSPHDLELSQESSSSRVIQWLYPSTSNSQQEGHVHPCKHYIDLGSRRVYVNATIVKEDGNWKVSTGCMDGGPSFFITQSLWSLVTEQGTRGLSDSHALEYASSRYGPYSNLTLPSPTVQWAFMARITSPLAVLQLVGKLLSALEENLSSSLMNMCMTLGNHYMNAKKSIVAAQELSTEVRGNAEEGDEAMAWVLRPHDATQESKRRSPVQWVKVSVTNILPGDVFYLPLPKGKENYILPVDALLLEGSCIALESVITGESVPQAKMPIDAESADLYYSMDGLHRSSTLFAGTTIIQAKNEEFSYNPDMPKELRKVISSTPRCLALRTGSYSSKGEIMRALSKSRSGAGSITTKQSEADSLRLITFLSIFAMLTCVSLFLPYPNMQEKKSVSQFRRTIQCIRIAVASIPSDLPLALSGIAHACSSILRNEADVASSEPGALLAASQVNMIVFDKTGTLTSDTQSMKKVVQVPKGNRSKKSEHHESLSDIVLAGCHSLVSIEKNIESKDKCGVIGDPLDIAALEFSEWKFDGINKSAFSIGNKQNAIQKIWQIKTFPFDPTRRKSSALLLVQNASNEFQLWKVVKGSPDSMGSLFRKKENFRRWYRRSIKRLGAKGMRVVALGAQQIDPDDVMSRNLFPKGVGSISIGTKGTPQGLIKARKIASKQVHFNDIESCDKGELFTFVGFGCFDAAIRPSTKRVVCDLRNAGLNVCMLTGDGVDAAMAVAEKAGFFEHSHMNRATLDIDSHHNLVWNLQGNGTEKRNRQVEFSKKSIIQVMNAKRKGEYVLAVTGNAIDFILDRIQHDKKIGVETAYSIFMSNLLDFSVFARTSPQTKQRVVSTLKKSCARNILMCGDGVNDIAAMKAADLSVALLNGYGDEKVNIFDSENERRKERILSRRRKKSPDEEFSQTRIKLRIEEALKESNHDDQTFGGLIRTITNIFAEERKRLAILKKGGAGAARILVEQDNQRKKGSKSDPNDTFQDSSEAGIGSEIKPGEVSLAAGFTFLRPCIDGAEAIVRIGIAAAAFSLSTYRAIALNSLMACFNLATLYRDGFRYGKYMWNVELAFIMALDHAEYQIGTLPRPRIATIRPQSSLFHASSMLSVCLQSIVHLSTLILGVRGANILRKKYSLHQGQGLKIRWANARNQNASPINFPSMIALDENKGGSILGRAPFRPNYITNTVFLLSVFQNTAISIVNHLGYPFNSRLIESKAFCIRIIAPIFFCFATATEMFPRINSFLELAPMPSKASKLFMLVLFASDGLLSYMANEMCTLFLDPQRWKAKQKQEEKEISCDSGLASDMEETLLTQDKCENQRFIAAAILATLISVYRAI